MATESEIWAKFRTVPVAAKVAYSKANRRRNDPAPAFTTEGTASMVATLTPAAPAPVRPVIARHIAAGLKGFSSAEQAYDAAMSFRAGWAKFQDRTDRRAEAHLSSRGLTPMAIATVADPTTGGYFTPEPLSAAIIERKAAVGASRQLATVVPMDSGELTVPVESTGLTVYRTAETATLTASDFTFGTAELKAEKRSVFAKVSNELRDDALIVWLDRFVNRAAYALASSEDDDFINGDGTSTYSGEVGLLESLGSAGVFTPTNGTGKSVWSGLALVDFASTMTLLPSDFANGNEGWVCSPQFYVEVILKTISGVPQGIAADGRPLFLNRPVTLTQSMPTTTAVSQVSCLYGSFSEAALIGDRGLSFAATDQALGAFDADITWMRANSRVDINVHAGGDSSNAGAYVGLSTAAS